MTTIRRNAAGEQSLKNIARGGRRPDGPLPARLTRCRARRRRSLDRTDSSHSTGPAATAPHAPSSRPRSVEDRLRPVSVSHPFAPPPSAEVCHQRTCSCRPRSALVSKRIHIADSREGGARVIFVRRLSTAFAISWRVPKQTQYACPNRLRAQPHEAAVAVMPARATREF